MFQSSVCFAIVEFVFSFVLAEAFHVKGEVCLVEEYACAIWTFDANVAITIFTHFLVSPESCLVNVEEYFFAV